MKAKLCAMTDLSIPVDVLIKDEGWNSAIKNPEAFCKHVIGKAKTVVDFEAHGELSIALINDAEIQALNKTYRGKDKATNVLSFPDSGPAPVLGDIVIARETVTREAEAAGLSITDHLTHMLIHGFLHLQGYDHENDAEAALMEVLEVKALRTLNIDNPYKNNEHLP